jgi:hypothetical protein
VAGSSPQGGPQRFELIGPRHGNCSFARDDGSVRASGRARHPISDRSADRQDLARTD